MKYKIDMTARYDGLKKIRERLQNLLHPQAYNSQMGYLKP